MDKPTKAKKQSLTAANKGISTSGVKDSQKKKPVRIKTRDKRTVGDEQNPPDESLSRNSDEDESPTKNPGGRPPIYTDELAFRVLEQLADGKSLRTICRQDGMPGMTTVFKWLATNDVFAKQYARAKTEGIEAMLEDCIEIADDGRNDWIETEYGFKVDREAVERSKLRVDVRKWFASKILAKKYGDKLDLNHGGQPDNPVQTRVVMVPAKEQAEVTKRPIGSDAKD